MLLFVLVLFASKSNFPFVFLSLFGFDDLCLFVAIMFAITCVIFSL